MNSTALPFSKSSSAAPGDDSKIWVLGVGIDNLTNREALDRMEALLYGGDGPQQVSFVYANCLNQAYSDARYRQVLNRSRLILADGTGLRLASLVLGQSVRDNQCGTDVIPSFLRRVNARGGSIFLLGSRPEVVAAAAERMKREFPAVRVCGVQHGYSDSDEEVIARINAARPDILLVGMGVPRQELWIAGRLSRLQARICIGVGAFFDYYSGSMPRAPQWMLRAGMEWVYRLYCEPRRLWRRYLVGNFLFLGRIYRQLLTGRGPR